MSKKQSTKSYRIILQFPTDYKEALEKASKMMGLKPSQFIKVKVLEQIHG